jgi:hypothetical protein
MNALRRRAWWALVTLTVLLGLFGIGDVLIGPAFDPGIALGLTGLTHEELRAESAAGYLLLDFYTRAGGANLTVIGVALTAIVLVPYRAGRPWAWWTLWVYPAWTLAVLALNLAFGVAPGQAPPPPMLSAPILGAIAVAALLIDRGRFFRAEVPQPEPVAA